MPVTSLMRQWISSNAARAVVFAVATVGAVENARAETGLGISSTGAGRVTAQARIGIRVTVAPVVILQMNTRIGAGAIVSAGRASQANGVSVWSNTISGSVRCGVEGLNVAAISGVCAVPLRIPSGDASDTSAEPVVYTVTGI